MVSIRRDIDQKKTHSPVLSKKQATTNKNKQKQKIFILFMDLFRSFTAIGWTISAIGIIQLPLWAAYAVIKQKGNTFSEKIRNAFQPNPKWGPKDPIKYEKYQKYITNWQNEITARPNQSIWQRFKQKIFG